MDAKTLQELVAAELSSNLPTTIDPLTPQLPAIPLSPETHALITIIAPLLPDSSHEEQKTLFQFRVASARKAERLRRYLREIEREIELKAISGEGHYSKERFINADKVLEFLRNARRILD